MGGGYEQYSLPRGQLLCQAGGSQRPNVHYSAILRADGYRFGIEETYRPTRGGGKRATHKHEHAARQQRLRKVS